MAGSPVTGLVDGTSYAFTVTTSTIVGASAPSSPSTPVAPLAQSTLMTGLGLAMVLVPAAADWRALASADATVLWAVVYYAVVPTVGGYLLWYRGAASVSGAEASLFTALAPVSGMALSVWLLGEALQSRQLFGAACVLVAILLPAFVRRGGRGRGIAPRARTR